MNLVSQFSKKLILSAVVFCSLRSKHTVTYSLLVQMLVSLITECNCSVVIALSAAQCVVTQLMCNVGSFITDGLVVVIRQVELWVVSEIKGNQELIELLPSAFMLFLQCKPELKSSLMLIISFSHICVGMLFV